MQLHDIDDLPYYQVSVG